MVDGMDMLFSDPATLRLTLATIASILVGILLAVATIGPLHIGQAIRSRRAEIGMRFARMSAWYRWNFTNRQRQGRHWVNPQLTTS